MSRRVKFCVLLTTEILYIVYCVATFKNINAYCHYMFCFTHDSQLLLAVLRMHTVPVPAFDLGSGPGLAWCSSRSIIPHRKDLNPTTTTTLPPSLPSLIFNRQIKMNPSVEEAEDEPKLYTSDLHSGNEQLPWSKVSFWPGAGLGGSNVMVIMFIY